MSDTLAHLKAALANDYAIARIEQEAGRRFAPRLLWRNETVTRNHSQ